MEEEKVLEKVEEKIKKIIDEDINLSNIDSLYKLIDIHKDLKNEEYWNKKKEVMENELQNEKIRR